MRHTGDRQVSIYFRVMSPCLVSSVREFCVSRALSRKWKSESSDLPLYMKRDGSLNSSLQLFARFFTSIACSTLHFNCLLNSPLQLPCIGLCVIGSSESLKFWVFWCWVSHSFGGFGVDLHFGCCFLIRFGNVSPEGIFYGHWERRRHAGGFESRDCSPCC